jgi:predicted metal-dependent hydrolase
MRKWRVGVSLDWRSGELAEGLACYGRREFFEAHEHWELVWLRLHEPEKSFVQAIIQITAAFHHSQQGNDVGTLSLLQRAQRRLAVSPATFGGIAVELLRIEIEAWVRGIESGNLPEAYPVIAADGLCGVS